jgi:hypothetical protein
MRKPSSAAPGPFGFGQHDLVVIDNRFREQLWRAVRAVSIDHLVEEGAYQLLVGLRFEWHRCSWLL